MPSEPIIPNLAGDRDIEWGFVFAHLDAALARRPARGEPADVLDFGPGRSFVGYVAALRGHRVTAVDLDPAPRHYRHPNLRFLTGNILTLGEAVLPPGGFDAVFNCSTIEHVGLAGRYTTDQDTPDGDLRAMARLRRVMRPGGVMLLTIPMGRDAVFAPMCRVYGRERLPRLIEGFSVEHEAFWHKPTANPSGGGGGGDNVWTPTGRDAACAVEARAGDADPLRNYYALGGFVLRKA